MRPETEVWGEDAEYDLQSAKTMLDSGRYFFVVFMCHLTIEKLLKSVIVERQGLEPPRTVELAQWLKQELTSSPPSSTTPKS
jgi:HEPN domain-containing protein